MQRGNLKPVRVVIAPSKIAVVCGGSWDIILPRWLMMADMPANWLRGLCLWRIPMREFGNNASVVPPSLSRKPAVICRFAKKSACSPCATRRQKYLHNISQCRYWQMVSSKAYHAPPAAQKIPLAAKMAQLFRQTADILHKASNGVCDNACRKIAECPAAL